MRRAERKVKNPASYKVERKGTYQGVLQWGITGSSEKTPSRKTAVKWAALANAEAGRRASASSSPTSAEVISALHRDFSGNYAAAARYAETVARQEGRDAAAYRTAAEWLRKAAKNPRKAKRRRAAARKKRRNPSRYVRGGTWWTVTARKPGGKVLKLVTGNKFAEHGKPIGFPTASAAVAMARWLRRMFPVLRHYTVSTTPLR